MTPRPESSSELQKLIHHFACLAQLKSQDKNLGHTHEAQRFGVHLCVLCTRKQLDDFAKKRTARRVARVETRKQFFLFIFGFEISKKVLTSIVKGKLSLAPPKKRRKIESKEEAEPGLGPTSLRLSCKRKALGFFICSKETFSGCPDDEMIALRLLVMI
jgi:hypothetical protein